MKSAKTGKYVKALLCFLQSLKNNRDITDKQNKTERMDNKQSARQYIASQQYN